jgi:ABC-type uncharacterized transport system substrate-binding protein
MCLLLCLAPTQAAPLSVTVVLSEGGGAYQEFAKALQSNHSTQYDLQIARVGDAIQDAKLVIAVGMKAARFLSSSAVPVLNVFVPRTGYEKLQIAAAAVSSAIYMDQPLERQLALLSVALPEAKGIGILYATRPAELESLRKLATENQFTLHVQHIDQQHSLASALTELLEVSEVLFVLPDAEVYSSDTIRNILLETYRKRVPMIGISQSYVRAGALCAVYSTPQQIAKQTAEVIQYFLVSSQLPASQYPKEFEVSVNTQVARSLGLSIKDAEQLHTEIRGKP